MTDQIRICAFDDLAVDSARRFDVGDLRVAVVRLGDDLYAIGDRCSHADVSLAEGELEADDLTLECPKHGSTFCLTSGEPLAMPAVRPVPVYHVEVRDGDVWLLVEPDDDESRSGR